MRQFHIEYDGQVYVTSNNTLDESIQETIEWIREDTGQYVTESDLKICHIRGITYQQKDIIH